MKDIRLLEKGLKGEEEIAFELKHANIGMYILHDITLAFNDLKAQIDYIIITRGYIYLVECKNLIGNITVNSAGEFKREYEFNGKIYKEAIYSPYTQAVRHKEIIKKQWLANTNSLYARVTESFFDKKWYKPLVVIANSKSLVNTKYAPREIRNNTIRVDQLIRYIKNDLENYDKSSFSSQKRMEKLANHFLNINVKEFVPIASKYLKDKSSPTILIEKLKKYRKEKAKKNGIPAFYIFTDEELFKLIESNIHNMDELIASKILSNVKVKCHGEEILAILNEQDLNLTCQSK